MKFDKRSENMTGKKMIIGTIVLIAAPLIIKKIVAYYPYFMAGAPLGVSMSTPLKSGSFAKGP
jgi:hypothetical protein